MKQETTRVSVRIDKRLLALLPYRVAENRPGPAIRRILAEAVGRPDLATVNPVGRPRKHPRED